MLSTVAGDHPEKLAYWPDPTGVCPGLHSRSVVQRVPGVCPFSLPWPLSGILVSLSKLISGETSGEGEAMIKLQFQGKKNTLLSQLTFQYTHHHRGTWSNGGDPSRQVTNGQSGEGCTTAAARVSGEIDDGMVHRRTNLLEVQS